MGFLGGAALIVLFALGWFVRVYEQPAQPPPFICYSIDPTSADRKLPAPVPLTLKTQFPTIQTSIQRLDMLCVPIDKELPAGKKPAPVIKGDHFTTYELDAPSPPGEPVNPPVTVIKLKVTDQFGPHAVVVRDVPVFLFEPADKTPFTPPKNIRPGG